jgi:hypothetical protein
MVLKAQFSNDTFSRGVGEQQQQQQERYVQPQAPLHSARTQAQLPVPVGDRDWGLSGGGVVNPM